MSMPHLQGQAEIIQNKRNHHVLESKTIHWEPICRNATEKTEHHLLYKRKDEHTVLGISNPWKPILKNIHPWMKEVIEIVTKNHSTPKKEKPNGKKHKLIHTVQDILLVTRWATDKKTHPGVDIKESQATEHHNSSIFDASAKIRSHLVWPTPERKRKRSLVVSRPRSPPSTSRHRQDGCGRMHLGLAASTYT